MASVAALLGLALLLYLGPVDRVRADQPPLDDEPEAQALPIRFATISVFVDAQDRALAAYQVELTARDTAFKVVGIEPAEHTAFTRDPDYDLDAQNIETDRLILANYTTAQADQLPRGPIQVATIHVAFVGPLDENNPPTIQAHLTAAYGPDGQPIDARSTVQFSFPE